MSTTSKSTLPKDDASNKGLVKETSLASKSAKKEEDSVKEEEEQYPSSGEDEDVVSTQLTVKDLTGHTNKETLVLLKERLVKMDKCFRELVPTVIDDVRPRIEKLEIKVLGKTEPIIKIAVDSDEEEDSVKEGSREEIKGENLNPKGEGEEETSGLRRIPRYDDEDPYSFPTPEELASQRQPVQSSSSSSSSSTSGVSKKEKEGSSSKKSEEKAKKPKKSSKKEKVG